jgi:hypothetical protein
VRWVEEVIRSLTVGGEGPPASEDLLRRLGDALSETVGIEEARDILDASSLVLHASSVRGELALPDWSRALEAMGDVRPDLRGVVVIGLGEAGHAILSSLGQSGGGPRLRRFFFDTETARDRAIDPETATIVLDVAVGEETGPVPRFGDLLRASYRVASGGRGLPPLLSESLEAARSSRTVIHVVAGLEESWVSLLPDLLFDIRSFLGWGRRGTCVLHLLARPAPKLRGSFLDAVGEIERTKPFDEAFLVFAEERSLLERVSAFIQLAARVPQILIPQEDAPRRGPFSSYGVARVPPLGEGSSAQILGRFETCFRSAAPSWAPANPVLSEVATESVFYVHAPESPPPDLAWKFCPELRPAVLEGSEPTLCRVQRGLKLEDLRLA